jgi:flagellar biogenesis protein FliO
MTDMLQPIAAIILVLSLLGGTLYVLRRRGMASLSGTPKLTGVARQMKVVERIPLGAQHALHLVRVGDMLVLVATAPGCCQMMDTVQKAGL